VTSDYRYELQPDLIAQAPAEPADASRLMFLPAAGSIEHHVFTDLARLLKPGDLLVVNETRVIRARLRGRRAGGGAAEVLLLRPLDVARFDANAPEWEALVRPGRRLRAGARVTFGDDGACEIVGVAPDGTRRIRFDDAVSLPEILERHGEMPLPPYVGPGDEARAARYQTIFARVPGSVAAPTASLHFTPRTVAALEERGVQTTRLSLDVSYGTFKPIQTERIADHVMHAERCAIPESTAAAIERAKREGHRIVAAGTTVLRALESAALRADETAAARATDAAFNVGPSAESQVPHSGNEDAAKHPQVEDVTKTPPASGPLKVAFGEDETSLFITPGFRFRVADVLLTNFHLPASSLLVLVAAFAGYERTMRAYALAIAERYRFYSFGDAMLIERQSGH
jgi:S-adenosylmethionine:tRNA ribosyltransferase-isomerase